MIKRFFKDVWSHIPLLLIYVSLKFQLVIFSKRDCNFSSRMLTLFWLRLIVFLHVFRLWFEQTVCYRSTAKDDQSLLTKELLNEHCFLIFCDSFHAEFSLLYLFRTILHDIISEITNVKINFHVLAACFILCFMFFKLRHKFYFFIQYSQICIQKYKF